MVLFALSLQDQVEKYGAYAGIAAFLGLAVLSLLYFAQAREVRRLREWAGRAPERAQELQERVSEQAAQAGSGRRVTSQPIAGRPGTAAARAGGSGPPASGRTQPPRPSRATTSAQAAQPGPPGASGSPQPDAAGSQERPPGDAPSAAAQPASAAATAAGTSRTLDPGSTVGAAEPYPAGPEAGRGTSAGTPPATERDGTANDHRPEEPSPAAVRAAGSGAATAAPLRTTRRTANLPRSQANDAPYVARRLPSEAPAPAAGGRRRGVAVAAGIAV